MTQRRALLFTAFLLPVLFMVVFSGSDWYVGAELANGGNLGGVGYWVVLAETVISSPTITSTITLTSTATGTIQFTSTPTGQPSQTPSATLTPTQSLTPTPTPYVLRLPLFINQILPPVDILHMQIIDNRGFPRLAYIPGEEITVQSSGVNRRSSPVIARLTWGETSSCGDTTVISDTVALEPGSWTRSLEWQLPDCLGVITHTLDVSYTEEQEYQGIQLMVNNPSDVAITDQQAFDKCTPPSVQAMQTWWNHSPYYSLNLYIGGISLYRDCADAIADPFWVSEVSQQGWTFIPTWVGPQAPCSIFRHKMHDDPFITYYEGRLEADAAVEAANGMGFLAGNIIYYDLEAFGGANQSCREAVKAFLTGWVERLHEQNVLAGVYGSGCGSFIADWTIINPIPDAIWAAAWYRDLYDPEASVWDVTCVSNSWWADHQRLRQYAGDHSETWGGKSFDIDSSAADGLVTRLPLPTQVPTSGLSLPGSIAPNPEIPIEIGADGAGWIVSGERLRYTTEAGSLWLDADVSDIVSQGEIQSMQAGGAGEVWIGARQSNSGQFLVAHTNDHGNHWMKTNVPVDALEARITSLQFTDEKTGWLGLRIPSSSNFNLGLLYRTRDGGQTWVNISSPAGGDFTFLDSDRGWMLGGPENNRLFSTMDGGSEWTELNLNTTDQGPVFLDLPYFFDDRNGIFLATHASLTAPGLWIYTTHDAGSEWFLAGIIQIDYDHTPAMAIPAAYSSMQDIIAFLPDSGMVKIRLSDPIEVVPVDFPVEGVVQLSFAGSEVGWARVQQSYCLGEKVPLGVPIPPSAAPFTCSLIEKIYRTSNNGVSWSAVTP